MKQNNVDRVESDKSLNPLVVPYPQRLKQKREIKSQEFLELFNQINVNLLLSDVVKQVLVYVKFLKDLCTVKHKHCVKNKTYVAEQVSSIIKHNLSSQFKDPGTPNISCTLGNKRIHNALLYLGSSANLLPYSIDQ